LELLVDAPEDGVFNCEIITLMQILIKFFVILEKYPHGLPIAKAVESRISHHHKTSANINLLLHWWHGHALLGLNQI